jgi:hypothetical protein
MADLTTGNCQSQSGSRNTPPEKRLHGVDELRLSGDADAIGIDVRESVDQEELRAGHGRA